ncbi:MAG: hypothetical protein KTR30_21505 [Saprospiraceae bacterium]|nr:hypothetical protein [Saprospiraceae bacterium]
MKKSISKVLLLVPMIFLMHEGYSHSSHETTSIFQTIVNGEYSEVILKMDFHELMENKKLDLERKAQLTLLSKEHGALDMKIKVRPRGVFRRYNCDLSPLRLNFDKDELQALGLEPQFDKLKLVLPCLEEEDSEQYLVKEYLAYKLYNQLTVNSFKVHLLTIRFVGAQGGEYRKEQLAFLIEHKKELARRLGGAAVDLYGVQAATLTSSSYSQTMMFNYMIGNLDWDLAAQRNVQLVKQQNSEELILVPYDFDFSAFVRPSYLRVNARAGQRSIKDRVLIGRFETAAALERTIKQFQAAQKILITALESCPQLHKKHKKMMINYLNTFYRMSDDEEKLRAKFL